MWVGRSVAGDVEIRAEHLSFGPTARLKGSLLYAGPEPATFSPTAVVQGPVRLEPVEEMSPTAARLVMCLQGLVGSFLFGLLWLVTCRGMADRAVVVLRTQPLRSVGVGALVLMGVPVVLVVGFVVGAVIGGWWIALFASALYGMAISLALPIVAMTLGLLAMNRFGRLQPGRPALQMLAALVAMSLVSAVPFVGPLVMFVVVVMGLGALSMTIADTIRRQRAQRQKPVLI
jgi:hypothetical protein